MSKLELRSKTFTKKAKIYWSRGHIKLRRAHFLSTLVHYIYYIYCIFPIQKNWDLHQKWALISGMAPGPVVFPVQCMRGSTGPPPGKIFWICACNGRVRLQCPANLGRICSNMSVIFFSDTKQNRYNCHPLQCFSVFYTEIIHEFEECAPGLGGGGWWWFFLPLSDSIITSLGIPGQLG